MKDPHRTCIERIDVARSTSVSATFSMSADGVVDIPASLSACHLQSNDRTLPPDRTTSGAERQQRGSEYDRCVSSRDFTLRAYPPLREVERLAV
jgi:hypothetical protein